MTGKIRYNVYDAYQIKDEIKRCVYLHTHFINDTIENIDCQIKEYITLHENGTFIDDIDLYCTTLVTILTATHFDKTKLKNYNYLYLTALTEISKMGTLEQADVTINRFKRNDFEIWLRRKKILSLIKK